MRGTGYFSPSQGKQKDTHGGSEKLPVPFLPTGKAGFTPLLTSYKLRSVTGFTLIEVMLVMLITVIMASLAIPNILRVRINSNEVAAISSLRTINNASQAFHAASGANSFPSDIPDLAGPVSDPPYIDPLLATKRKQGYVFEYQLIDSEHFNLYAEPESDLTGKRYFFCDETGRIRFKIGSRAGASDGGIE